MVLMAREVIKYSLVSGAEQAVTGYVWLGATTSVSSLISGINAAQNTLWQDIRDRVPTQHELIERKLEELDPATGAIVATHALSTPTNPTGANIDGALPLQVSQVLTFRQGGPASAAIGRVYLPPLDKQSITATGLLQSTYRTDLVDAHGLYFDAVKLATGAAIGVWSKKNLNWVAAGSIDMGSVPDTQRRRRHKLVESRYNRDLS